MASSKWYDTIELTNCTINISDATGLTEAEVLRMIADNADQHEKNQTVVFRLREATRRKLGWERTRAVDTPLGPGVVLDR